MVELKDVDPHGEVRHIGHYTAISISLVASSLIIPDKTMIGTLTTQALHQSQHVVRQTRATRVGENQAEAIRLQRVL